MKRYVQVLSDLRGGLIESELTEKLNALCQQVQATGAKGSLTITLGLEPHGAGNREIHVFAKVSVKTPINPDLAEPSVFFAVRGDLVRDDPDQAQLFGKRGVRGAADGGEAVTDDSVRPKQETTAH